MDHHSGIEPVYLTQSGPSRLVRDLSQADNFKQLSRSIQETFNHLRDGDCSVGNDTDIDAVDGASIGQVVQGIDGDFFVVVDDDEESNNMDYDGSNDIHIIVSDEADPRSNSPEYEEVIEFDGSRSNTYSGHNKIGGTTDEIAPHSLIMESIPQGLKNRKNRQYGNSRCPECGASFINTARLERHLAVHQVFGSFLCPLCGKTYKYEYNLFHHWRKTCRDLNELVDPADRQSMDVNQIRQMVDDVAQKKTEIGPIDIGIGMSALFHSGPQARLEMPQTPLGRRGTACRACGVVVVASHMPRHLSLHSGTMAPDQRASTGGYFCDLCGLAFRHQYNLIKHWRTSCPEIQANLPENAELTLDDRQLKIMICDLLKKAVTNTSDLLPNHWRDHFVREPDRSAECEELVDQLIEPTDVDSTSKQFGNEPVASTSATCNDVVFADDFGEEEDTNIERNISLSTIKAKWKVDGAGVQCPECFRSFANPGRLERHIAGFHSSSGSHHCILCGNRFKYDYNLLHHYRRSCQYTRTFIDRDVREQMDAVSLRKVVRQLAHKEVKLTPRVKPETMMMLNLRRQNNIARLRKEPAKMLPLPPPQLLQPRPGVPDARPCPVCGIVFYGERAVSRHLEAMHSMPGSSFSAVSNDNAGMLDDNFMTEEEETIEDVPPVLEPEINRQGEVVTDDADCSILFIEKTGRVITQLDETDAADVHRLMESGGLRIGHQMILVDDDVEVSYIVVDIHGQSSSEKNIRTIVLERCAPDEPERTMRGQQGRQL